MTVLDENSPRTTPQCNIQLFPHQEALIYEMMRLESIPREADQDLFITLSDKPGAGKSYAILGLIKAELQRGENCQTILICPNNIFNQWQAYFAKFSAEIKVVTVNSYEDVQELEKWGDLGEEEWDQDVILMTPSYYQAIRPLLQKRNVYLSRLIIDEIDSLSFYDRMFIPSEVTIFVSATACALAKGPYQKKVKAEVISCDSAFIAKSITLPAMKEEIHKCKEPFSQLIDDYGFNEEFMAKIYAECYSAITNKFTYSKNARIHNTLGLFSALYNENILLANRFVPEFRNMQQLEERKRTGSHLVMLEKVVSDTTKAISLIHRAVAHHRCPMCFDVLQEGKIVKMNCCGEVWFCHSCLSKFLTRYTLCPLCQREGDKQMVHEGPGEASELEGNASPEQGKLQTLARILKASITNSHSRHIVFSDYSGTFDATFHAMLSELGIAYTELGNDVATMNRALEDYRSGKSKVLLLDATNYGSGANLEMTTSMTLYHDTANEKQVIGRAQRYGRNEPLVVHKLQYDK